MKTTWLFNVNKTPFPAEVGTGTITFTKGRGGTGWRNVMFLTGAAQGFIDLGQTGYLTAKTELEPKTEERTVTIRVERYNDGFIFAKSFPTVSVAGWTKVSESSAAKLDANAKLGWGGKWFVETTVWKGTGNAITAKITSPVAYPWTALINSVEIES